MNATSRTHLLLIEDNPADIDLIKILLKDCSIKHELHQANTLYDGVDTIKNKNIDLILLDLTLPDSSGFKTLTNLLEKITNVPIIVLTGVNNEIVGNQAIKAGAQDFLVKGQFDGKLLGRAIRYSLQRYKTHLKLEEVVKDLAISEKRYVDAQEMAHFGNWEVDIVSNEMKWTEETYRVFGFKPNSFKPTLSGYLSYVHNEDKEKVEAFFNDAVKDSETHELEHRIIVDGTNIKHLAIRAKAFFEEITNKILLVGVLQDVTERKISEQLIIEKNISSKTSKIKEEALADMSFHIRTPLSSIINLLYLVEKTTVGNQQQELIDGLKVSVDDLSIMINNLLNFSVLVSEKINLEEEELNLKDFLQGVNKVMQIKADTVGVNMDFTVKDNIWDKVICDSNKLTQILYNLFEYIIRHSGRDESVSINVQTKEFNEEKFVSVNMIYGGSILTEEETAEILDSERLLQIYSEQQNDINKAKLGMAIVLRLIKTLGGSIEIDGIEEKGNRAFFEIPVRTPKLIRFSASDKPEVPIKILLVEDHFLNQIATKKILTAWSDLVSVDIAENGLIAVDKFREHGYNIILMDIQMPVMNGIESSIKIREQSQVPIIALTANSSKQEADHCYDIGINDYMAKPFKPEDLYIKIMSLLSEVRINNPA